jgi:hypothetical protein
MHCRTQPLPLQLLSVTLGLHNSRHCANFEIFLSGPSTKNNTACTYNVASLITVQEHSPSCPCAHVRLPQLGATFPSNVEPVISPCPVSFSEGEPQTGAISKGGTKSEPREYRISKGESYTSKPRCDSPQTISRSSQCPLCTSMHGRGESI